MYLDVITQANSDSVNSPFGYHLRRLRSKTQPAIAARARVLHPLVHDHPQLLRDDVHLLAGNHADLLQHCAVVWAHALGLGQLVANHVARQVRVQRFASALHGALVRWHLDRVFAIVSTFFHSSLGLGTQDLSFVEEHVLLVRRARLHFLQRTIDA